MFELIHSLAVDVSARTARGRARISADHPFLVDHFPGAPVLPGSMQIELCAQIGGPLSEEVIAEIHGIERWSFLGMVRSAAFLAPVRLPASLRISANVKRAEPSVVIVTATMERDDGPVLCRAELVMMMRAADPSWAPAIRSHRQRIEAWKGRA